MENLFSINETDTLDNNVVYDVVIIGRGPAGLTAAIYAGRFRLNAVLFERIAIGGQIITSEWIENYPGFPEGITGIELMQNFEKQALKFGTKIISAEVKNIKKKEDIFCIDTIYGEVKTSAIILATGAEPIKLPVKEEEKFRGKGISYCATCDAAFFKDKSVAVVGGGDTAIIDALTLTKFAKNITVIHRRKELRAAKILQERAFNNPKIKFELEYVPISIKGEKKVESLEIENVVTKEHKVLNVDGIFVAIGTKPNSELVKDMVELDERGFVKTDMHMQTSLNGLFAVGDVRNTPLRQVVTACGDAAIAAAEIENLFNKSTLKR